MSSQSCSTKDFSLDKNILMEAVGICRSKIVGRSSYALRNDKVYEKKKQKLCGSGHNP